MLVGRYRGEYGAAKQLQSDGNMPALLAQETSRLGRGSMSIEILCRQAARCQRQPWPQIRYNRKQGETDSVQIKLPAPLKVPGPGRQNHTAGQV